MLFYDLSIGILFYIIIFLCDLLMQYSFTYKYNYVLEQYNYVTQRLSIILLEKIIMLFED